MAYQVFFADMTEENKSLVLTLLRLKEEAGQIEPSEIELLAQLRGPIPAGSFQYQEPQEYQEPQQQSPRRGRGRGGGSGSGGGRRSSGGSRGNGRSQFSEN